MDFRGSGFNQPCFEITASVASRHHLFFHFPVKLQRVTNRAGQEFLSKIVFNWKMLIHQTETSQERVRFDEFPIAKKVMGGKFQNCQNEKSQHF